MCKLWFDQVSDLIRDHMKRWVKVILKLWDETCSLNVPKIAQMGVEYERMCIPDMLAAAQKWHSFPCTGDASPLHLSSRMSFSLHRWWHEPVWRYVDNSRFDTCWLMLLKHVNFQCDTGRSRWNTETSEIRHGFRLVNFLDATRFNLEDTILDLFGRLLPHCHILFSKQQALQNLLLKNAASFANCASLARRWHEALPCRALPPAVCCCIRWTGRARAKPWRDWPTPKKTGAYHGTVMIGWSGDASNRISQLAVVFFWTDGRGKPQVAEVDMKQFKFQVDDFHSFVMSLWSLSSSLLVLCSAINSFVAWSSPVLLRHGANTGVSRFVFKRCKRSKVSQRRTSQSGRFWRGYSITLYIVVWNGTTTDIGNWSSPRNEISFCPFNTR